MDDSGEGNGNELAHLKGKAQLEAFMVAFRQGYNKANRPELLEACEAALLWAKTPGNHGGNPYKHDFVVMASKALGDWDK